MYSFNSSSDLNEITIKLHKQKKNTLIYLFNPHQNNLETFPQTDLYNWTGIFEIKKGNHIVYSKLIHTFRLPSNPIIQGDSITDIE